MDANTIFFDMLGVFSSLKPPKIHPKIDATTSQKRPRDAPKSRFGGGPLIELEILRSWGASWGVLEGPGGVLGASWRHLGVV